MIGQSAVITTNANTQRAVLYNRMPVILERSEQKKTRTQSSPG